MLKKIDRDYSKLRGKIREVFTTQEAFAAEIPLSDTCLSYKLNNQVDWKLSEIERVAELLCIPHCDISDYFFTRKVEKN